MADDDIRGVVESVVDQEVKSSFYGALHPAGVVVNSVVYAHRDSSSLEAGILEIRQGTLHLTSSSMQLSSTLNFVVPNQRIQDCFYIKGTLNIPQWCVLKSMWFLDAINNIQIQIPGSGTIQYFGSTWKDMLLRCSTESQRDALNVFMPYVNASAGATDVEFCCPVVLPWSFAIDPMVAFPLDGDSYSNNLTVSITLKPAYQWICASQAGGAHARVLPTAFSLLELKPLNVYSHIRDELSLGRLQEEYRVPSYYLQTYAVSGQPLTGALQSITLQQMPNAQLATILLRIEDDAAYMTSDNTAGAQTLVNPVNIRLSYMRLNFNGLDLIELSSKELDVMKCYSGNNGDGGLNYTTQTATSISNATSANYSQQLNVMECFMLNTSKALTDAQYSLTQNYNGQTMTLYFIAPSAVASTTFTFSYVSNCVWDTMNGSSKLVL